MNIEVQDIIEELTDQVRKLSLDLAVARATVRTLERIAGPGEGSAAEAARPANPNPEA